MSEIFIFEISMVKLSIVSTGKQDTIERQRLTLTKDDGMLLP